MSSCHEIKILRIFTKGDSRFGFTLVGQYPCTLDKIQHGSPAEKAGIKSGDELLEANGVNVEDLQHNCVASFITPNVDGITELRIRRALKANVMTNDLNEVESKERLSRNNNDMSHAVNIVVASLEQQDIFPSKEKDLNLSTSYSDDLACDEQLKTNFAPVNLKVSFSDISTLNGLNLKSPSQYENDTCVTSQIFVGYLGSINRPLISASSLGLVTHLRIKQKSAVWVSLELSSDTIYIRNSSNQIMMTSPLKSLVYFGFSRENKQILALLTANVDLIDSHAGMNNHVSIIDDCNLNCSCHVLVINSNYNKSIKHSMVKDYFQLQCHPSAGSCRRYFPTTNKTVISTFYNYLRRLTAIGLIDENELDHPDFNGYGSEVDILRDLGVIIPQELVNTDHFSASNSDETQHEFGEDDQVLCLYLRSLYKNISMKEQGKKLAGNREYNIKIFQDGKPTCTQESSGGVTLTSHHIIHIATPKKGDTSMADERDFRPSNNEVKAGRTGHKTQVYQQRSHSLASNVRTVIDAHAAAVTAIAKAQTFENSRKNFESGHCDGQLNHASSTSMLSCKTVNNHPDGNVARWAVSFDHLLKDKIGLQVFKCFLQKEFSEENLVFWLACEKYKMLENKKKLKQMADEIYDEHLKPCANQPVNVDATALKEVESSLEDPCCELLKNLQSQIYTLMKFDSYTRFLKSELYRECLVNEMEGKDFVFEQEGDKKEDEEEIGTLKRMFSSTKVKVKKPSKPQASQEIDDIKKKSILPWRGRLKSDQSKRNNIRSTESQASSTRSSLSSLSDSVFSSNANNSDETLNDLDCKERPPPTCKVILPNTLSMFLFCKSTRSLHDGLLDLCVRHGLSLPALSIFLGEKELNEEDLKMKLTRFINKEIILLQKILFRMELPNDATIGVIASEQQTILEVIQPILRHHDIDLDNYSIVLRGDDNEDGGFLDIKLPISTCHQKNLIIREKTCKVLNEARVMTVNNNETTMYTHHTPSKAIVALDHKVFDGIMMGKRQSMSGFCFDDLGVFVPMLKMQMNEKKDSSLYVNDKEKQHLSRSPALFRKKKRNVGQTSSSFRTYVHEEKKNTEEFFVLLHRSQNSRMDDQRGLLNQKNIELPEFLKDQDVSSAARVKQFTVVPSSCPSHEPLKKTTSSPSNYSISVSKQPSSGAAAVSDEFHTISRFTRHWSGSELTQAKIYLDNAPQTQTIDRKKFFKHVRNQPVGRVRAGSLPYTHPDDRCTTSDDVHEWKARHHESQHYNKNSNTEVVWVSNIINKNRERNLAKTDNSVDTGYESTTEDEGAGKNIPEKISFYANDKRLSNRVSSSSRSSSENCNFKENMATAKYHIRALVEQSENYGLTSTHDRQAILDNSFLRDELKPLRLYSQVSPKTNTLQESSINDRNDGKPMKCPLFTPALHVSGSNDVSPLVGNEFRTSYDHVDVGNEKIMDGNVRVTFV